MKTLKLLIEDIIDSTRDSFSYIFSRKEARGMDPKVVEKLLTQNDKPVDYQEIFERSRSFFFRPFGYAIDPVDGSKSVFSTKRIKRPDWYRGNKDCEICRTDIDSLPICGVKKLNESACAFSCSTKYGFLNPEFIPDIFSKGDFSKDQSGNHNQDTELRGLNILVWPTTEHKEVYELTPKEHAVSFQLISDLETALVESDYMHLFGLNSMQVIRNVGSRNPNKKIHGPYQVALLNHPTKKIDHDIDFLNGVKRFHVPKQYEASSRPRLSLVEYLSEVNEPKLTIKETDEFKIIVPYFIKRPLQAMIFPKDTSLENFRDLNDKQRVEMASAINEVSYALKFLMPARGREIDYSLVFHTGPIGTMYIKVHPYSQRYGGFENVDLSVCEGTPFTTAQEYKEFFKANVLTNKPSLNPNRRNIRKVKREIVDPIRIKA